MACQITTIMKAETIIISDKLDIIKLDNHKLI